MKKKRKIKSGFVVLLVLTLIFVITKGFSYARYASNAVFNYYLSSKGFYFESEDLSFDTKNNVDTMWDGEKVYFTISNNIFYKVHNYFEPLLTLFVLHLPD